MIYLLVVKVYSFGRKRCSLLYKPCINWVNKRRLFTLEANKKYNRIKEVLKAQGRKQSWLADELGKNYVIVTRYVNNKTQPSIETLREIARVLDVDVRELLEQTKP
jgi:putative transcriptional regulator